MRILKRISAMLICCAMLLSVMSGISVSATEVFRDVSETNQYKNAITSLVSLDLLAGYPDGTFGPEKTITRAEFAAVITRALGMEAYVSGETDISYLFTDMKNEDGSNHWGSGYVKFAYDTGIILGMGGGIFAPDSPVTYEQAMKMVVCTLGYGAAAEEKGGWPQGYLVVGNDLGLTKNAVLSPSNAPAVRGIVAQIVYNALEVELVEKTSAGTAVASGKTLLKDKLKVNEFKNYMITNIDGETTINASASGVKKGEMLLERGDKSMIVKYGSVAESADLKSSIGYYISGYYRVEDEENILISLDTSSAKNVELVISDENIETYSDFKIEYWENKSKDTKVKKVEFSSDIQLIYNGMVYDYKKSSYSDERDLSRWIDPESEDFINGSVKLLDSDGDNYYDAVFIEDFEVYVVKNTPLTTDSIVTNNYIVYDYYNNARSVRLDPLDDSVSISIKNARTGSEVKVESLKTMDILSVAKSMDESMFTCYVAASNTVMGTIKKMSDSQQLYTIGNKEYKLTDELAATVEAKKVILEVGTNGTYYLDHLGRIAAVKITAEQTGEYGYITIGALTGATKDTATVKIMSLTGTPATPTRTNLAEKVKINGKNYTDPELALGAIEDSAKLISANSEKGVSSAQYSQLVRFVKNSKGEISSLTTVCADEEGNIQTGKNTESDMLLMGATLANLRYNGSGNFAGAVFANSSTKVIVVPDKRNEDTEYKRYSGYSSFKAAKSYNVEAYDINASGIASVLVVYGADTSTPISSDTKLCIINDITTGINTVNEKVCYIYEVYEEGTLKTYETENDATAFANVQIGDIVRFGFNGDGHINSVRMAADLDNLVFESYHDAAKVNNDYKFKTIVGTVATKSDEIIMVAPAEVVYKDEVKDDEDNIITPAGYSLDESAVEGYPNTTSTKLFRIVVKSGKTTVESATWESIVAYSDVENNTASIVFAHALSNKLKLVVVYVIEK